jgi:MioC protein
MFETRKFFIICSSSCRTGDIPDNGAPFFETLSSQRPNLSDVRYGTVALGDMTYSATFCGGGLQFDSIFRELGATRLVDPLKHDRLSGSYPEDAALAWLEGWLDAANSAIAA